MSSQRWRRQALAIALAVPGVERVDLETTGGQHLRLRVTTRDGRHRIVITSLSPSDHRTSQNLRRDIRHALRAPERAA